VTNFRDLKLMIKTHHKGANVNYKNNQNYIYHDRSSSLMMNSPPFSSS